MSTLLFVCTGNTCRSPMAEGLMRHALGSQADWRVESAGIGAINDLPPSQFAVSAMRQLSIDISDHRSQMLSHRLVQEADLIVGLTHGHAEGIRMLYPEAGDKTYVLGEFVPSRSEYEQDIQDPMGGPPEAYIECRDEIAEAVTLLEVFLKSPFQPGRNPRQSNPPDLLSAMASPLQIADPYIANVIRLEGRRQEENIELIASENFTSPAVREAQGSLLTNKYAEGYPGKRWYGGCEYVDLAEQAAIDRAKQLFGAEHANVQPHSGSGANMAVYFAMLKPGDKMLTMDLSHGGHLTHGNKANFSGKFFQIIHYGVRREDERIDYDQLAKLAREHRPRMITVGASAYSRIIDFERMGAIAREVDALMLADIAHIAGLVATGLHPSPILHADFVTTTTHKTLRGPRGGLILCRAAHAKAIDSQAFPGIQGGPLMHVIAAKAVCFHEALQPPFKAYQEQVVNNARALAAGLERNGFRLVGGGTDNHLVLVDVGARSFTGKQCQHALDEAGITTNKNTIPFETRSPFEASGVRLGTPAVTTRGMKEQEMAAIADMISEVLLDLGKVETAQKVRARVRELTARFPLP